MAELDDILARLPAQHGAALEWFRARSGQEIAWPQPLPDGTHLVNKPKGIHKPKGWDHALSVRQSLQGSYADEEPVIRQDGTWTYRYFQEQQDPDARDSQFTNRALLACRRDGVPVAVLRQTRPKPDVRYRVLGLARVAGWDNGYFEFEGYSPEGHISDAANLEQSRQTRSGQSVPPPNPGRSGRLPAEMLLRVTPEHVWHALEKMRTPGFTHPFGPSTDFDLATDLDERFPPKAVFGTAATEALGFDVLPQHFSGGDDTPCFRVLRSAGFDIIRKGNPLEQKVLPATLEDREWIEGGERLVAHLRKERASGLAAAKKAEFKRLHERLWCERCRLNPVEAYGEHGEACIEVHHSGTHVQDMQDGHRTRLEDLQCLCANCHRVVHRALRELRRSES